MIDKSAIVAYWTNVRPSVFWGFFCGENPSSDCWACGYESGSLERCHLIPDSRGGSVHPSNLILMCKQCHHQAPSVGRKKPILKWLFTRENHQFPVLRGIEPILKRLVPANLVEHLDYNRIQKLILIELEKAQMHDGRLSVSTKLSCIESAVSAFIKEKKVL